MGTRWILIAAALLGACDEQSAAVAVPGMEGAAKSPPEVRASRRAYDGAPPVIPHSPMSAACGQCHNMRGIHVPEHGFAPPSPHAGTERAAAMDRCTQCHAYRTTEELFIASTFRGLTAEGSRASRAHDGAPPVIPHPLFLRGNCLACHDGPAAREAIRCSHPTRTRCKQCHVPAIEHSTYPRQNRSP